MKNRIKGALIALTLTSAPALAQFDNPGIPTQATAGTGLSQSGLTINLQVPVHVANGGTNSTTASGTSLDNITGFNGTGFLKRTGAGAYTFVADPLPVGNGGTAVNSASGTALDNITGFSSTGYISRTGTGTYSFAAVIPVAGGGTNASSASGTALDNITGFASTGFMSRTGAGTYSFTASTGSGSVVLATSPTLVTPTLGVASATSLTLGTALSIGNGGTGAATATGATAALQYLQGGTSSSAHSDTSKFQERVSVMDFGAVCQGADESSQFQAALTYAGTVGGKVEFPQTLPGTTRCTFATALTIPGGVTVEGQGQYSSILRYTGTGSAFAGAGSGNDSVTIRDLTLQLTGTNAVAIDSTRLISSTFRNLHLVADGTTEIGIYANPTSSSQTPFFNVVDNVVFDGPFANAAYLTLTSPAINAANRWRWIAPTCLSVANCLNFVNVSGAQVFGLYINQQTGYGVLIGASSADIELTDTTQETESGGTLFNIDSASNRNEILGYKTFGGSLGIGSGIGLRGMLVADWDTGVKFSTSSSAAISSGIDAVNGLQNMSILANNIIFNKVDSASDSFLPAISQKSAFAAGSGNDLALASTDSSGAIVFYTGPASSSGAIGTGSNAARGAVSAGGRFLLGTITDDGSNMLQVNGSSSLKGLNVNGIQADASIDYEVPLTGGTINAATATGTILINPAGTLSSLSLSLPGCGTGNSGVLIRASTTQIISGFSVTTVSGNVSGYRTSLAANQGIEYICRGTDSTWYELY